MRVSNAFQHYNQVILENELDFSLLRFSILKKQNLMTFRDMCRSLETGSPNLPPSYWIAE